MSKLRMEKLSEQVAGNFENPARDLTDRVTGWKQQHTQLQKAYLSDTGRSFIPGSAWRSYQAKSFSRLHAFTGSFWSGFTSLAKMSFYVQTSSAMLAFHSLQCVLYASRSWSFLLPGKLLCTVSMLQRSFQALRVFALSPEITDTLLGYCMYWESELKLGSCSA